MFVTSDPNLIVGGYGLGLLALAVLWRLVVWIRDAPPTPDPWDAEIEQKLQDPEIQEICHRCLTPHEPGTWFCRHCGTAVGPYNNLMPFLNVFSEGEVLRNGIHSRFRNRWFVAVGYSLIALGFAVGLLRDYPLVTVSIFSFVVMAYWISVLRNLKRLSHRRESDDTHDAPPS
ncbi:MAG TPA: hypothetical protein VMA35_07855 [Candidatus Sulfopaludibacter sp.]|nr:hypothetical protein [Candidatus Sulfopaludibacter sp.]